MDAGTPIALRIKVTCPRGCDLQGNIVQVHSPGGILDQAPLATSETNPNEASLTVTAPSDIGAYEWFIVFPQQENATVQHEASRAGLSLTTLPHKTTLAVWDISSPVVMSGCVSLKVGTKCSAGCELAGHEIQIVNDAGIDFARATLGTTPWPGTSALYWVEASLAAPSKPGNYLCNARFGTASVADIPHEEASFSFHFLVTEQPEHCVTVKLVDKDTQTPINGVEVRLGPQRAATDEGGTATLPVAKGTHEVHVWKLGYEHVSTKVAVTGDTMLNLEIASVPEPETPYWMEM